MVADDLLYRFKWSISAGNLLTALILVVAAGAALDWRQQRIRFTRSWLVAAALTLLLAVICRQLDVRRHFTGLEAWLQGHALWHTFTCLSPASVYLYHRSENST